MPNQMKTVVKLLALFAIFLLPACAGNKKVDTAAIFFPPPPNPPRIQYLTGINGSVDIEGQKNSFSFFSFGQQSEDEVLRWINKPYGISTHDGKIYVSDMGSAKLIIIDPVSRKFEFLKGNYNVGKMKKPTNSTVDKDGRIYVSDIGRKEVLVYSPAGDFVTSFGRDLEMKPADVAVDDKYLYVLDIASNEIKVLDRMDGVHVKSIGKWTAESEGLSLPTNFKLGPDGFLYVTNAGTCKVIKLDRDGHIISSFGSMGDGFGQFARPKGIAVDDQGRIFVVDGGHQNVQAFTPEGRLLIFFGDPGLKKGSLNLPTGVATTKENLDYFKKFADPSFEVESLVFVANQYGNDKISVYGLGHLKGAVERPEAVKTESAPTTKEP